MDDEKFLSSMVEGVDAFTAGVPMSENPYSFSSLAETPEDEDRNVYWMQWNVGYYKARKASLNKKF